MPLTKVTAGVIAANAVVDSFGTQSITGDKLGLTAINANNIVNATITGAKLVANTVTGDVIGQNAISSNNIVNSTITTTQIASNTISNTNIQTGAIENYSRATGLLSGMRNRIINGAMVIDQRNAGSAYTGVSNNQYTLDRWVASVGQSSKMTVQQNAGSVTPPAGFTNYLGITVASAVTPLSATDYFQIMQKIEGFNTADLNWGTANAKTVTLSFWVRSNLTGTFGGALENLDQTRNYVFSYIINSANTWEQKSITVLGDTTGTWNKTNGIGLWLNFGLGTGTTYSGTAGSWTGSLVINVTDNTNLMASTSNSWYVTGVQLEVGSTATSFDYRPYGTELALCQRYYETGITGSGSRSSDNYGVYPAVFKVTKRANPTVTYVASGAAGGLGGYYLGPNTDGFVGYSTSATAGTAYYFTYTAAIEL